MPHSVKPSCVQSDDRCQKSRIDLDSIRVSTGRRVNWDDFDVVIPHRDQSAKFAAAQGARRLIDLRDVQMVTREWQESEQEDPSDHRLTLTPLTTATTDHRHHEKSPSDESKRRGSLDCSPDHIGCRLDQCGTFNDLHNI